MDNYEAIKIVLDMARAYDGLMVDEGFVPSSEEDIAILTVTKLLEDWYDEYREA